ncbi:hypothetical protein F0P96_04060 [Hymenobacter busanensis]|uniref:Uncharacterized protein n=1 Tax=Hymenobacter busanensis TaxID=2607656 RepID=A0A7L4ZTY6_9BACT|nr:hypothetical protein [Hymenobacter busanensis]KAA9339799.1 hypothetical protein F0P96_04060 [Hymenobacter busanensis]QHJ06447.1 hypothetical protein GUY19_03685 [Hymenobacter busanensis]
MSDSSPMRLPRRFVCFCLLPALLLGSSCARLRFFQPDARLSAEPLPAGTDSVTATAGRHYQQGLVKRLLFGQHYRRVWATPVRMPVLDLGTAVAGGLRPGKIGGGFQTTSMTLLGTRNREFALRSLDKDPFKTLPKAMRETFLLNIVRDATSAGNPYGAFVVPPLAQAAGIRHTSPRLFYVRPDENGLGPASERFRGKVVMLEEKLEGEQLPGSGGGRVDIEESEDMLAALYTQPGTQIDQTTFVRARLLDIWLGDWDRHEGQWTWEKRADGPRFSPVPKDRDQVFYRFDDGPLAWLGSRFVAKFRTFRPRYESIEGYTRNARFIDSRVLHELDWPAYRAETQRLQQRLTDSVITRAARRLPREVYAIEGPQLVASLQARRAALPTAARTYYQLLAERVTVPGTDEDELFEVQRLTDTTTVVSVYSLLDDKKGPLRYRRTFRPAETRQVMLHGLGGKDVFRLTGSVRRSPRIDIYGGPQEDTVQDSSRVAGLGKKTRFYDTRRNNVYEPGPETKDKRSHGVASHAFDRDGSGR